MAKTSLSSARRGRAHVSRDYTAKLRTDAYVREAARTEQMSTIGMVGSFAAGAAQLGSAIGTKLKKWEQLESGAEQLYLEGGKDRDVEDFISKPIPLTAYQEELQKYYESPVESFLKKKVCYFYHNQNTNGVIIEYSFSKLYKDFNYWLCSNNEKISYTKRKFSLELGNLEIDGFKKEKKSGDIICSFNIPLLLQLWNIQLDNVDKELILLEQDEYN